MLIHGKTAETEANGPGNRSLVHFQGCEGMSCRTHCWNPDSWAFDRTKEVILDEVAEWILANSVDGVTFSGGEPMQAAHQLYVLVQKIKATRPELSIGMFTGYTQKELDTGKYKWKKSDDSWQDGTPELWQEIKKYMDFAIMGRYNERYRTTDKPLCGSSNQEVVFFNDRYSEADLQKQTFEIEISEDLIQINGFPIGVDLEQF